MKPYYQDERAIIFHGDCREIMPTLPRVDLVVTDPPYGMSFRSNMRTTKYDYIEGDDRLPLEMIELSIAKAERAAYVCCRWDNLVEMPAPKSVLAWVKNGGSMGDLQHEHGRAWEAICFYPKARHRFRKRISDVVAVPRTGNELHPTQKPVELFRRIIAANEGDLVLDPYLGSGTTAEAALRCRRRVIGIEIDERYCEIAAERCFRIQKRLGGGLARTLQGAVD